MWNKDQIHLFTLNLYNFGAKKGVWKRELWKIAFFGKSKSCRKEMSADLAELRFLPNFEFLIIYQKETYWSFISYHSLLIQHSKPVLREVPEMGKFRFSLSKFERSHYKATRAGTFFYKFYDKCNYSLNVRMINFQK